MPPRAKRKSSQVAVDGKGKRSKGAGGLRRDEELSEDEEGGAIHSDEERRPAGDEDSDESDEEDAKETAEEARLRIAKQYLKSVEDEIAKVQEDDDAETFNRDAIAHRLQQDVTVSRGRQFKAVADKLVAQGIPDASNLVVQRGHKLPPTSLALAGDDVAYTSSKDGSVLRWDLKKGEKRKIFPVKEKHGPSIHALAVSTDGRYVGIGGKDQFVHVYDDKSGTLVQSFKGHRGTVSALAFQRGTHQLFSGSHDRTIKIWNLDEMCYVETLFGHQSEIMGIASLHKERCVTAGRDRTVRLWKVVEESQLVFRGHTSSIDSVSILTEEYFAAGGQDGAVSLWSSQRKKPTVSREAAHGRDQNDVPNSITAVAGLAHTDLLASGSCDGFIRLWRCGAEHTSLTEIKRIPLKGFVNALQFSSDGRFLVAAVGQEHRLGRWTRQGDARNGLVKIVLCEGSEGLL